MGDFHSTSETSIVLKELLQITTILDNLEIQYLVDDNLNIITKTID